MKTLKEALFSKKNLSVLIYTTEKENIIFSIYLNDNKNLLFELKNNKKEYSFNLYIDEIADLLDDIENKSNFYMRGKSSFIEIDEYYFSTRIAIGKNATNDLIIILNNDEWVKLISAIEEWYDTKRFPGVIKL